MLEWELGSLEYLKIRFTIAPDEVTTLPVHMSVVPYPLHAAADDWHIAHWEPEAAIPTARLLVGPGTGAALDLTLGTYILRARVTDADEQPILRSGLVRVI